MVLIVGLLATHALHDQVHWLTWQFPPGSVLVGDIVIGATEIKKSPCRSFLGTIHILSLSQDWKHPLVSFSNIGDSSSNTSFGLVKLLTEEEMVRGRLTELALPILDSTVLSIMIRVERMLETLDLGFLILLRKVSAHITAVHRMFQHC